MIYYKKKNVDMKLLVSGHIQRMFRFRTYKHKETQVSIEDFLCKYDRFAYL